MNTLDPHPLLLDETLMKWRFIRSPGPGGQRVNKVATGVQLRYPLANAPSLPDEIRARAIRLAGSRLNRRGEIVIEATRFRSQEKNREDARRRLVALLTRAATPVKPRKPTRPSASARARRLEEKRHRGERKAARRSPREAE